MAILIPQNINIADADLSPISTDTYLDLGTFSRKIIKSLSLFSNQKFDYTFKTLYKRCFQKTTED